jgi:exopolysaccharide biosynthesis polyprenyl glycosylphosphotransferase
MSFEEVISKPPSLAAEISNTPAEIGAPTIHAIPAWRGSAVVVCDLLRLFEALIVGSIAWSVVSFPNVVPATSGNFSIITGTGAAGLSLLGAAFTETSRVDGFASRTMLFPSALMVSAFVTLAAWLGGANHDYIALCATGLFASVYVAKIPTALFKSYLDARGVLCRLVAVVGETAQACQAAASALTQREDVRVVRCGPSDDFVALQSLARDGKLNEIVLAGPNPASAVDALAGLPVTLVRIFPEEARYGAVSGPTYCRYGRWGAPAAIISNAPLTGWAAVCKRLIDVAGALTAIILFSPILLVCMIAIKLDSPGPIFFMQERVGFRNQRFRMFKFRSMRNDMADKSGAQLTQRNDPRVTRVGNFLRRSSADELPQLFNVLLGDMSLVGPRPHPLSAKAGNRLYEELIPNFYARYRMKPGITGLAQISGYRGNTETEQHLIDRFRSDQLYVSQWTPLMDIVILFRTIAHLFEGTNAF